MPTNAYWDEISALEINEQVVINGEVIKRYGVIQTIIMEENRLFASREDDEELKNQIEGIRQDLELRGEERETQSRNFLLSRKRIDAFTSLFGLLYLPELFLKYVGASIVDMHVAARRKNEEGSALWLIPWAITGALNACVAQPLFLASNAIMHTRCVFDGLGTIAYGCATLKPKAIWAGVKGLGRGIACLAIDALAIGVMIGVAVLCSLIFQPHVALGIIPLITNVHTAAVGAIAQATIATATGVTSAVASVSARAAVSAPLSTTSCLQKFSTQPAMKQSTQVVNDNPETALPRTDSAITTGFGFRTVVSAPSSPVSESELDSPLHEEWSPRKKSFSR